jgi:hypothetical protein
MVPAGGAGKRRAPEARNEKPASEALGGLLHCWHETKITTFATRILAEKSHPFEMRRSRRLAVSVKQSGGLNGRRSQGEDSEHRNCAGEHEKRSGRLSCIDGATILFHRLAS